jgi:UDP-N-acetylmuramate dehydrogenase
MTEPSTHSWFRKNVSLAEHTYYKIGSTADYFAEPESLSEVQETILFARRKNLPLAFLGAGSNSLFSDSPFPGVILSFKKLDAWHWESEGVLFAEGGVENSTIAQACLDAQRKGAAWMHKLPGQVGATTRMNARCYGGEISQIISHVVSIDLWGNIHTRPASEVFLGYKNTFFMKNPEAIVGVRFVFPDQESSQSISSFMSECESDREQKHHFDSPSCGSTFKNNYDLGIPSGKIFDSLGLKGLRKGGAMISNYHANFIQNTGTATAHDVLSLAAHMRNLALTEKNAELDLEVEAIGSFDLELLQSCGIRIQQSNAAGSWSGLAMTPNSSPAENSFPVTLFSSPFLEYFRRPQAGETHILATIQQLISLSEAKNNPDATFLRWSTQIDQHDRSKIFPHLPQTPSGSFVNELWEFSVSEIFWAHPTLQEYDEYEMTPEQHWIAIAHDGRRVRKVGHDRPSARFFPHARLWSDEHAFGMDFCYASLSHLIQHECIRIQCCLSLGGASYHLAPHWMNRREEPAGVWNGTTPPSANADFHQPHRFWKLSLKP